MKQQSDIMLFAKRALLMVGDFALLYTALYLALVLRYQDLAQADIFWPHVAPFTIVFVLWIWLFAVNHLYDLNRAKHNLLAIVDLLPTLLLGILLAVVVFYLLPSNDLTPKRLLVITAGLFVPLWLGWRWFFNLLINRTTPPHGVWLIGSGERMREFTQLFSQVGRRDYRLIAQTGLGTETDTLFSILNPRIDTVVVAEDAYQDPQLTSHLFQLLPMKIRIFTYADFYELYLQKVPVSAIDNLWFLRNLQESDKRYYDIAKRASDVVLAGVLLVGLFPILIIAGLLVTLTSAGYPIYAQQRVGAKGQVFWLYKLRTMIKDAERTGPQWTTTRDPRITPLGRWLRITRLDELPQLINILRGEMSFIGPRPERPEFITELERQIPYYNERHLIAPGLTGWAQVRFRYGASVEDALEKLQYDLYYIKHRSITLDAHIWIHTMITVMGLAGR